MPNRNASVLILTPMKSAGRFLDTYFAGLERLSYPHDLLSLGILEGDSSDGTFETVEQRLKDACTGFQRKILVKKDFGFSLPEGAHRHAAVFQEQRRAVLARARNRLDLQLQDLLATIVPPWPSRQT